MKQLRLSVSLHHGSPKPILISIREMMFPLANLILSEEVLLAVCGVGTGVVIRSGDEAQDKTANGYHTRIFGSPEARGWLSQSK